MVKPYHRFPEYSSVPLPLLRELAEALPGGVPAEWRDD